MCPYPFELWRSGSPAPASAVCVKSILRIAPVKSPGVAVLGLYDGVIAKSPPKMSLIMTGEWV